MTATIEEELRNINNERFSDVLCNLLPLYNVFCLCYNHITVMYKLGFCFTYVQNVHLDVTRKKKCHFRCLILFSCSVMHVVENCPSPMTAGALKSGEKLYEEKYVKKLENYVFHHPFFFFYKYTIHLFSP